MTSVKRINYIRSATEICACSSTCGGAGPAIGSSIDSVFFIKVSESKEFK